MKRRTPEERAERAQRRLAKLGWVLQQGETILDLIRTYQDWHGLTPDGEIGPQTLESIEAPRFCGLPDRPAGAEAAGQLCKWQDRHITWCWTGGSQLGVTNAEAAFELAWQRWADVCGIKPERVDSPAQADVVMGAGIGREAGPSGTLAWSELPCSSTDRQLQQRYDTAERWVVEPLSTSPRGIDLVRVACHEIGHAIGLPHQPAGNLMAPTYSTSIHSPQSYEIGLVSADRMYGPPLGSAAPGDSPTAPKPDPGPAPGDGSARPQVPLELELVVNGRRGKVVWE